MKKLTAILLIISVLVLTGCMMIEEMYISPEEPAGTTQSAVDDVDDSMGEIDDLDVEDLEEEIDLSELDDLEKELDDLNW